MTWQPLDCHAHTTLSDGALTPEELIARAAELGVRPSICDHISGDVNPAVRSIPHVELYLAELEKHEGIGRGGEFCWHDALWRDLPLPMVRRFTHRVGSVHAVFRPGGGTIHAFARDYHAELTPDRYMQIHVDNLLRLTLEMPVDILAHPTLLPLTLRPLPLEEVWSEAHEARAIEGLRRAKIAFEVSNRYRPHERFIKRAIAAGVRISLGSDGHSHEQVADIAWPLAEARRLGVHDSDLYDPWVHGSKTGFFGGDPARPA